MTKSAIPKPLIDQIKTGQAVLFLGAGAAFDSSHSNGDRPPTGQELSDLIAGQFLGEDYIGRDLQYVSELAISETDLFTVQKFIAEIFFQFGPGEHHLKLADFVWKAIFTTNYDRIIEEAYERNIKRKQELATFIKNGERVQHKMTSSNNLMYVKLHGSISDINDESTPLILSPDQYVNYRKNRTRLFSRLEEDSYESSIIFVGFSFADLDIRATLNHLNQIGDARPVSYMVGPYITEQEERMWDKKKIHSLRMSFKEFMFELDRLIPDTTRTLSKLYLKIPEDHPISKKFDSTAPPLNEPLLRFLSNDVIYLHSALAEKQIDPKNFYKGYFVNFDPIIRSLDVERKIKDKILSEVFLIDEEERQTLQEFILIKGNAGSGKTVLLKRLAWDASITFDKICLFYNTDVSINYDSLYELYRRVNDRIYLFVDRPIELEHSLMFILDKAAADEIPLTVIGTIRTNVWNIEGENLKPYLSKNFELTYLTDSEIDNLIELLTLHRSLNYLEGKPLEKQREALGKKAGRELLVALHEATAGKPFADIVLDEYNSIPNEEGKNLYLTICLFHRLGTYARAGLISRIHDISFNYFEERLFKPLESIVFTQRNYRINDFNYITRHQNIAELIFEHVLVDSQERQEKYCMVLSKLDVDFSSDFQAFLSMTNAKKLTSTFNDLEHIREIYRIARKNVGEIPELLQQEAIFEMGFPKGDLNRSSNLLSQAIKIDENNTLILHSKAELALKKANRAENALIRKKYFDDAKEICENLISDKSRNILHAYHTMIKIKLEELKDLIRNDEVDLIDKQIQNIEKFISRALQNYPDEDFILAAKSDFNTILNDEPKALDALNRAWEINQRSPYLAIRLSDFFVEKGEIERAMSIISVTLGNNQMNLDLNFNYAVLLMQSEPQNYQDAKHYFRRAFAKHDNRYEAQFWYARACYLLDENEEASEYFNYLKTSHLPVFIKRIRKGVVRDKDKELVFDGTIIRSETTFGIVKRDFVGDTLYFDNRSVGLSHNYRVKFKIWFNYLGPIAEIVS